MLGFERHMLEKNKLDAEKSHEIVWFYTAVRFDKPRMMMIKNISR
jgi:hypothetical protein